MMNQTSDYLSANQIEDLRLAAKQMHGPARRRFEAEMAEKYCEGKAWKAAKLLGWDLPTIALGLREICTGLICWGAQALKSGRKRWEDQHPEAGALVRAIAEEHAQQDPTFNSTLAYTRLTAAKAIQCLSEHGIRQEDLPAPSTMAKVLNRLGYKLRKVIKAKPQRKVPETDAIFENIAQAEEGAKKDPHIKRLSIDCKATVRIGDYSRGGKTRGDNEACDHDMGCQEKYTPFGILDQDINQVHLIFGSSYKTSDFIVDGLEDYWSQLPPQEQARIHTLEIKVDNGPESNGVRTQFLKRIVDLSDTIGKTIHLLYYPPYHSKYNPIERCWGVLELHWNGAKLTNVETMLHWAGSMTWKGVHPIVRISRKVYDKGISLTKKAMQVVEARLDRHSRLPKWDIRIKPQVQGG